MEMGCVPGQEIQLKLIAPFGDPLAFEISGYCLSMRRTEAERVEIVKIQDLAEKKELHVVLSGNPNCGKSSLFNELTGLNQRITNIPGTTIERKTGKLKYGEHRAKIVDTPGTYSIDPKSTDEKVALEVFDAEYNQKPDLIVYVADASNFKRNLFFFSQLAELGWNAT